MIIVYGKNNVGISRSRMDKKKEKIPKNQGQRHLRNRQLVR